MLVQELLRAKRDLRLERLIKKLNKFEALIIDDLGYVQQSREEMEVLFTLLAERYERGSVLVTSEPTVLKMGADLQGPDDNRSGDRPPDPSLGDHRTQHPQLPTRGSQEETTQINPFRGWIQTVGKTIFSTVLLIVAKGPN